MNLLKLSLASALLTVGIAVSVPLSAAQIGGPVTNPRDPGGSWLDTWTATVCTGTGRNTQCITFFQNTGSQCQDVLNAYLSAGWRMVAPCEPTSP